MKIAHVGSDSVHVDHFTASLKNHGVTNILIAEEECGFDGIEKQFVASYRKPKEFLLNRNKAIIRQFLLNEKPDVVHIHQFNRLAYFVSRIAQSLQIPIIGTAWGSDVLLVPNKNWLLRSLVKSTIKRCAVVTADAESMIEAMRKMVTSGVQYEKIQYGIDPVTAVFPKEKIIFSNRLHKPLYRVDQIIRYYAEAVRQFPDYRLVVAASGNETEHLKALVKELEIAENVEFVGWLTSKQNRSWYARSAYYISIPSSDGTSVSLMEAVSGSCIPIVSDLPSNREWIDHSVNGIIESGSENPIVLALSTSFGGGIELNAKKITGTVSREVTIPQFISYYERCIDHN